MFAQVRVLVEEGKADLSVQDRWGTTPLDEAMRTGSRAVMDYLRGLNAPTQKDDDRTVEFLYAASRADTAKLRHVSCLSRAPTLMPGGSEIPDRLCCSCHAYATCGHCHNVYQALAQGFLLWCR